MLRTIIIGAMIGAVVGILYGVYQKRRLRGGLAI
jgi:hypothetical protein